MELEPFYRQEETHYLIRKDIFSERITAGITSRCGGVSTAPFDSLNTAFHVGDSRDNVLKNRQRAAGKLGFSMKDWVAAEQVHKAGIVKIDESYRSYGAFNREQNAGEYDGMYTRSKGILLASFYADCVPLLFYAPAQECAGVAHAGWKGTYLDIGGRFVRQWQQNERINPEEIFVVIGPAISGAVYEVDREVINKMELILPKGAPAPWQSSRPEHWYFDVKEMNRLLLENAGIPSANIFKSSHCTYTEAENFFSHRRDHGQSGRMMAFIGLHQEK
ncbi:peptidoglycan editing factor PgeF [Salibacterium aidingense]|uniref:peptidoglycan editing factor PgeF n=1 Tax=Salibacterium aidingense TaxID=384933 RepID=UPI0004115827|nr:peptidoglycan editing factor PgeF [Salibacterium aidingense]